MSDTSYNVFQHYGTHAARLAFTPTPGSGQPIYIWYETDTGSTFLYDTSWHQVTSSGTLPATVQGDILYASGVNTVVALAKNASATRYLSNTGASNNPAWAQVALATGVSGTLPVANGGTAVTAIPKFSVNKGGTNQTGVVTATYTKLTWSTEVFDTNANFASDKFTPTIAGKYIITAGIFVTVGAANAALEAVLYKNGVALFENVTHFTGAGGTSITPCWIVDMNGSTDYLELYTYQDTGSNKIVAGDITLTYFMGSLLP
jgi:hypothetical protein